ncbi:MAG: aminotransferase class I/II-fold pyridoxal phosphate-dependent enzyme [Clostridiaceae bacterium]
MKINNRLNMIPEKSFYSLDEISERLNKGNKELYNFGVGDPTIKIRKEVMEGLLEGLKIDKFNNYPPYSGIVELKREIIKYYKNLYNVNLDEDQVIITIGSKDAIVSLIPAVCNFNDSIIITEPSYPIYKSVCSLWGVNYNKIPITESNNYLPNLNINERILNESKILLINYPNNPTGAAANDKFYQDIIKLADKYNLILVNDGAYNEIIFNDKPISLLQFDNNKKSIEIGSFSKIFNMTGFRIGYAVGNKEVIKAMLRIKKNLDSGQFIPIQYAAISALRLGEEYRLDVCSEYYNRKEKLISILKSKNINFFNSKGGIYLWCNVPKGYSIDEFCYELIEKYGIIVSPGYNFGTTSYGYFRIALTGGAEMIEKAFSKLKVYS